MDEKVAPLPALRPHLPLDVPDLAARDQIRAVEELPAEQAADLSHRPHLVRGVTEDHVDVGADEGEAAAIVGEEHRIRDVLQGDAMTLLRLAQGLKRLGAPAIGPFAHGSGLLWLRRREPHGWGILTRRRTVVKLPDGHGRQVYPQDGSQKPLFRGWLSR